MIDLQTETDILASCLPVGKIWEAKNIDDTNLRNLLIAFASIFLSIRNFSDNVIYSEMNLLTTINLITEYEALVDSNNSPYFLAAITLSDRIRNVCLKLCIPRVAIRSELISAINNLFGISPVIIQSGRQRMAFPLQFPIWFCSQSQLGRYVFVKLPKSMINNSFPLQFPIQFVKDQRSILEALINWVAPANRIVIFEYVL